MLKTMIILMLLLTAFLLMADEELSTFKAYNWSKFINDLVKINPQIRYDQNAEEFYLFLPDNSTPVMIYITEEYRKSLYEILRTYLRKEQQATSWEETLDEELTVFPTAEAKFKKGSSWYTARINSTANVYSQSPDLHHFIIFFSNMTASENKAYHHKPAALYFGKSEAKAFRQDIKKKNFDNYIKKLESNQ